MLYDDIPDTARVLVCVMRDPADLERVRALGWYRIPVRATPRGMAAEYLAFYQTGAFGTQGHAVRYAARVARISLARRCELLPEEPQHPCAEQQYWRFALEALKELPVAIPARRLRRVAFIATTWGQIRRARDVAELWHAPEPATEALECVWGAGVRAEWA